MEKLSFPIVTDMKNVRAMAKIFLHLEIAPTDIDFIATHPFTNTWITAINEDGLKMVDLHDKDQAKRWREHLTTIFEHQSLSQLFLMVNAPYRLTFLKSLAENKCLSESDFAKTLTSFWATAENNNIDINVDHLTLINWFDSCSKEILMDADEYQHYLSLPDQVTIYRGVTSYNNSNKTALSWTLNKNTALWFANRFSDSIRELWTAVIPKDRILCYFNYEDEVIVNMYGLTKEFQIQRL